MEKKEEIKKIRWSIPNAMSCIYKILWHSKLKFKETSHYKTAMERLQNLYGLSTIQIWILCYVCERYLEDDDSTGMKNLGPFLDVPVMEIMNWKKEVKVLIDKGFLEWQRHNVYFEPTDAFIDSMYENTNFVYMGANEIDDTEFLSKFAERYESRGRENMTSYAIQRELRKIEERYKTLPVVQRVIAEVEDYNDRFFLYDVADDVIKGSDSSLDRTIADLYDGRKRYEVATQMMDESHVLFKKGLLEFTKKVNFSEASFSLSSKGKKLLLGEKAFLFEDSIGEKDLIKNENIKTKQLFYSEKNQKEIIKLKNALREENLKKVQQRLEEEGLPVGVAVLLYGAPGTGKTESVMQIAKETGRSIIHVDISEAKSAWFGESEKRIKKIFTSYRNACELCEKKGEKIPILLFNEADALISKRKGDTSGNCAQTENAIQNIILEELENLKGIFIATTNLADNMDRAFERRFLFKIKFENPSTEAKVSIWMDKLPWMNQSDAREFATQYDLSGGQIDNIVRKITMNEVITGDRPEILEIHDMCKSEKIESENTARRMGFAI